MQKGYVQLYQHNDVTYQSIVEMFDKEQRVAVVQPTGTGKSFLFLKWIEDNPKSQFILLSPSTEIFEQARSYVKDKNFFVNVTMVTYQELILKTEDEISEMIVDKIILDEFHRAGAPLWGEAVRQLLNINSDSKVLGLTATPIRYLDDAKDMALELFDNNLARYMSLGEAVQTKILPTPRYVTAWYDIDGEFDQYQENINSITDTKKRMELQRTLDKAKRSLDKSYGAKDIIEKHAMVKNGKYIVFCRSVEHIETAKELIKNWFANVNSVMHFYISVKSITCATNELPLFDEDEDECSIKFLFTVDRLNEGVHVSGIDGVLMLRPTISPTIYLQQMGRALASSGKEPVIFDMVNNYSNVNIKLKNGEYQNVFEYELRESSQDMEELDSFEIFEQTRAFNEIFDELEMVLCFNRESVWIKKYTLLKEFMEEYSRMPYQKEIYKDIYIGLWCHSLKRRYHVGLLPQEKINQLNDIGFVFDNIRDVQFSTHIKILEQFVEKYNRMPHQSETYEGARIGSWYASTKDRYRKGKLKQDQINQLQNAGFIFGNINEIQFDAYVQAFKQFMQENSRMPQYQDVYKEVKIGSWCRSIKVQYNKGLLAQDKIDQLNDAGFVFGNVRDMQFAVNLEALKKFIQENNRLPQHKDTCQGINIGHWCHSLKQRYKKGQLSQEQIESLTDIGFDFKIKTNNDSPFVARLKIFKRFMKKYQRMPKRGESYAGVQIGNWCDYIKTKYKAGRLKPAQVGQLIDAGFVFPKKK